MTNGNPNPSSLGPLELLTPAGGRIYLDHNATTMPATFLKTKVGEWLEIWGNPSSIHASGRGPKALLREARRALGHALGCEALELIFTSGGSEANNLAIKGTFGYLRKVKSPRQHYLLSAVEHPSVTKAMQDLRALGARVDVIPVLRSGQIDLEAYRSLLSDQTALVSVMYANNETGNVFPIKEMAAIAHEVGALFHCDGVQALGKASLDLKKWGVDLASFAAHKFYSLKGTGVLYARRGVQLETQISGGGQERGRRAGTENILSIAAMGAMAPYLAQTSEVVVRMTALRDRFEKLALGRISGVQVTGAESPRIPNTSSLIIPGVDGETLLMNLDMQGYSVSTGAACSSGSPEPSPVLLSMGLTRDEAQSSLRVSLGWGNTQDEIDAFIETLVQVVERLRSFRHGERALLGV